MGVPLQKPPLVEVLCELHFGGEPLASSELERLRALLALDYAENGQGQSTETPIAMLSSDRDAVVQLGARVLIVSELRRYSGWPGFRERIVSVVEALSRCSPLPTLGTFVLRYLNLFKHQDGIVVLGSMLRSPPVLKTGLGPILGFEHRQSMLVPFPPGTLSYAVGTGDVEGQEGVLFELAFASNEPASFETLGGLLDGAHEVISDAFVASLTEAKYAELRGIQP